MRHRFAKSELLRAGRLLLAALGFAALLWGVGFMVRPDLTAPPPTHTEQELEAVRKLRDTSLDLADPPRIQVDVDYGEGRRAAWWPKGESPILAELVKDGKLEPLKDRVGPEPVVLEGADGIGKYGGTWVRAVSAVGSAEFAGIYELGCGTLVRFSPQRDPIVPFLAKEIDVSEDKKVYTVHLREGVRWSDGHPLTTEDIMFWWEDWALWERKDEKTGTKEKLGWVPETVKIHGKNAKIVAINQYTIEYRFPEPNGIFVDFQAGARGATYVPLPAHYLRNFHPEHGKRDLIDAMKKAYGLSTDKEVFDYANSMSNPDRPRLGPWILRRYTTDGPVVLVRNPYYWAVDTQGNQLPYLDKIVFLVKNVSMIDMAVAGGETSVQNAAYGNYTLLMSQRDKKGYEVYHWLSDQRSVFSISPNLNRIVYGDDPVSKLKSDLLSDKRFRKALSLAINRRQIIDAEWNGVGEPSQLAPGRNSFYHYPKLSGACVEYDPKRAGELLDELGLTRRDVTGFRKFHDGTPMVFFISVPQGGNLMAPAQFVVRDWAKAGIRAIARERGGGILFAERFARKLDFMITDGRESGLDVLTSGRFIPENEYCTWATGWGRWYHQDGMIGSDEAKAPNCIEPPADHPIREAMQVYDLACRETERADRKRVFQRALDITAENLWTINISTPPPVLIVVKNGLKGVPKTGVWGYFDTMFFNCAYPETWYWEDAETRQYSPEEREQIKDDILRSKPQKPKAGVDLSSVAVGKARPDSKAGGILGTVIKWACAAIGLCLFVLVVYRHPYIGRRLLIMIPTLVIISVIVFAIIQIPPGDFLTTYMEQLRQEGAEVSGNQIRVIEEKFHLKDPMWKQYCNWVGLTWFFTYKEGDKGLLQGDLGMSMASQKPVNDIVGDRILLTVLISLGTVLFTWAIAVPIGIYSAVKQYSLGDYVLTVIGFIGMCVPEFLLALVLVYLADTWFGIQISGLFSPEYADPRTPWTWAKIIDLLRHIWVPVVVLGLGGTAGMIRVMRGNLLDELKKPYVVTARAKGVRPLKLLLKYPVRLALNPFISGIGGLFPMLVSGGAIVAMVLSLPTVGPLMLDALMSEDMYLAGSMLMVLSLLGVLGVLVSDLLLLWLDPRIRFERGSR